MKKPLNIPNKAGFCKNCFRSRRDNSSFCGQCQNESPRQQFYQDKQENFPLLKEVKEIFPIAENTILTYGDTIYYNWELSYHLVAHELTHCFQQQTGAEDWWETYIKYPEFRLKQEVEAYHNQYECVKRIDLKKAEDLLILIAEDLSGKLYGNIVDFEEAKNLIKTNGQKNTKEKK
jgi:hypothetical protein